eukprot:4023004-Amphidinium_carterae.1
MRAPEGSMREFHCGELPQAEAARGCHCNKSPLTLTPSCAGAESKCSEQPQTRKSRAISREALA